MQLGWLQKSADQKYLIKYFCNPPSPIAIKLHYCSNIESKTYVTCCRKVQSKESLISAIHPHSQSQINEQTIGCNWSLQNINTKRLESENLDFGILKIQSVVSYNSECQRKSLKQKPAKGDIYFHNYCNDCMLDCLVRRPINWKSLQVRLFAMLLEKDKDLSCTFPMGQTSSFRLHNWIVF